MANGPSPADVGPDGAPVNPYREYVKAAIEAFGGSDSAKSQVIDKALRYGFDSQQYANIRAKFPRAAAQLEAEFEAGKVGQPGGRYTAQLKKQGREPWGGLTPGSPIPILPPITPSPGGPTAADAARPRTVFSRPPTPVPPGTPGRVIRDAGGRITGVEVQPRPRPGQPTPPTRVIRTAPSGMARVGSVLARFLPQIAGRAAGAVGGLLYPSAITPETPIPRSVPRTMPSGPVKSVPPGGGQQVTYRRPPPPRDPGAILKGPIPGPNIQPGKLPRIRPATVPGTTGQRIVKAATQTEKYLQKGLEIYGRAALLIGAYSRFLPKRNRNTRSGLGLPAIPSGVSDPLTAPYSGLSPFLQSGYGGRPLDPGAKWSDRCDCKPKKRKPRKSRTVCYQGTYTEKARGLKKTKRRKVPCK